MVIQETFSITMKKGIDIEDITHIVNNLLKKSRINNGIVNLCAIGSTASITTIEYEKGVISDLKRVLNNIAPESDFYQHNLAWNDGNGFSHVQAAIMNPSLTIPINNQSLLLGTWQQIILINHDNRARNRKVVATFIGE